MLERPMTRESFEVLARLIRWRSIEVGTVYSE